MSTLVYKEYYYECLKPRSKWKSIVNEILSHGRTLYIYNEINLIKPKFNTMVDL